jgi:hypothetical protein
MINPYSSYVIAFCLALFTYSLGWSDLYPPLSTGLLSFLIITIVLHVVFSLVWRKTVTFVEHVPTVNLNPVLITTFIYALWVADFVYEGGVPLIKILFNQPYDYRAFGVPSLHVFTVTFASFFTVYLFSAFLATGQKIYFSLYLVNLVAALLIYSRAMLIFNIVSSVFVFALWEPHIRWRRLLLITFGFMVLTYFFGVLGTLRVSSETKTGYDSELFLDIGNAVPSFRNSYIPGEFFWGYIYFSSPLANLQQNINTFPVPPFSFDQMSQLINNEMLPDFVSKRVNRILHVERVRENNLPKKPFNVSTAYSRSFSYQGWAGMIIMAIFVLIFPLLYVKFVPSNQYTLTGVSILCTMYLFLFYDNTLRFTGLALQLIYPFALPTVERTVSICQKVWAK